MRGCAALAVTIMFASAVRGDPSSPFGGSQSFETASPKGSDWQDGDRGVVEERGAATYSYSFPLPPGRGGAVPSVSLNYSSAAPLRGGVAVGWSLDVGQTLIEIDDSAGIGNLRYTVGGARLVEVPDAKFYGSMRTFRVLWDASFTRYELHRLANGTEFWVVARSDGSRATYDHFSFGRQWRLTNVEDTFGNRADYTWITAVTGPGEFVGIDLEAIEYSSNQRPSLAGSPIPAHARVTFSYTGSLEFCKNADGTASSKVPIGAELRFATSNPYKGYLSGARRLTSIAAYVKDVSTSTTWRPVRGLALSYDMDALRCDQAAAPLRYITKLQPSGFLNGVHQTLPAAVKFGYGPHVRSQSGSDVTVAAMAPAGLAGNLAGETHALQDVDGDGRDDLVWIDQREQAAAGSTPSRTVCQLNWIRGIWGGGYDWNQRQVDLPTAPWHDATTTAASNHPNSAAPYFERCTLGGQHFVRQEDVVRPGCSTSLFIRNRLGYHFLDWNGDGRVDLLTNLWKAGKYNPELVPYSTNDGTPVCGANQDVIKGADGRPIGCSCKDGYAQDSSGQCRFQPDSGGTGVEALIRPIDGPMGLPPQPENSCDKKELEEPYPEQVVLGNRTMHIWRVYTGTGSDFSGLLTKVYSPLELPTPGTEGQYARGDASTSVQTMTDVDGDGWMDAIATPKTCTGTECTVNLGSTASLVVAKSLNGGSRFVESGIYKGLSVLKQPLGFDYPWGNHAGELTPVETFQTATLRDMNGDGRPDLVVQTTTGNLVYYPNATTRFLNESRDLRVPGTPVGRDQIKVTAWGSGALPAAATRVALTKLIDIDSDGLPDLVNFDASGNAKARVNLGDAFSSTDALISGPWSRARRLLRNANGFWRVESDFTDVTGDGLPDLVAWSSQMKFPNPGLGTSPPRLLNLIDNGRGEQIRFEYASSSDPSARDAATDSEREAMPWHLPSPTWLVKAVEVKTWRKNADVTSSSPLTVARTEYRYADPVTNRVSTISTDGDRPASFLGFRRVRVRSPAPFGAPRGAETVRRYRYDMGDGRGYLTQAEVYHFPNATTPQLMSVTIGDWITKKLFDDGSASGGQLKAVLEDKTTTYACAPGQQSAVVDCLESPHWTQTYSSWIPYPATGAAYFFVRNRSGEWRGDGTGGTHSETVGYEFRYGSYGNRNDDYRVLPTRVDTFHDSDATSTRIGRAETSYDPLNGTPIETRQWFGPGEAERVVSRRTFDAQTGVLMTDQRAEHVRLNTGKVTAYTYDDRKLFVAKTVNELGQTVHTTTDVGTGALLKKQGPNFKVVSEGCDPLCYLYFKYDEDKFVYDAFGRQTEHWSTLRFGETFSPSKVAVTTYDDVNNTVTSQALRDPEWTPFWITSTSTYDGSSRLLSTADKRSSETVSLPDAVTTYEYDSTGQLVRSWQPNPIADGAAPVSYTWERDSLSRPVRFRKPDNTGVDVAYGVSAEFPSVRTVVEVTNDASGGTTIGRSDVSGRLIEVEEQANAVYAENGQLVSSDATWTYYYDDLGRMTEIDDAEGNVTLLTHDWLGRRTKIERDTRVWKYEYDHDGNMTGEVSPHPVGATDAQYRSATEYDALGRPRFRSPATRGTSLSSRQALWIGPTYYFYDEGVNGVGNLTRVEQHKDNGALSSSQPPSTKPYLKATIAYDGAGNVSVEQREFNPNVAASPMLTQMITRTYNAVGAVTKSRFEDSALASFGTGGQWIFADYDPRGLPQAVHYVVLAGAGMSTVADYGIRGSTGAARTRTTWNAMYSQFGGVRREWSYDVLGRSTFDCVTTAAGCTAQTTTAFAVRGYDFDGASNVEGVTGYTRTPTGATSSAAATYSYDRRHRLVGAVGPNGYAASLAYNATGNIRTASINGMPDTRQNRNVKYKYGAVDAQAVDQLVSISTDSPFAQMSYDTSGNVTSRSWPLGSNTAFTWDGEDQLRQTSGADGVESYFYDHTGNRVWAVEQKQGGAAYRFWFGELETNIPVGGDPATATRYLQISDAGGALARVEMVGFSISPTIELQFSDALQNMMLSMKMSGTTPVVTSFFHYGAFGEIVAQAGQANHRRQFNGKEHDLASGLRYYGARYYDPLLVRWFSSDPLFRFVPDLGMSEPQRANLYAFSLNSPTRYFDPDGRNAKDRAVIERKRCGGNVEGCSEARKNSPMADEVAGSDGETNHSDTNVYRQMKDGADLYQTVDNNPALQITGAIVESTPVHSGMLWMIFTGLMKGPKAPMCPAPSAPDALVKYDGEFAARQLLGQKPVTPGGREIMSHAAERMVQPPAGRAPMTMAEVDQVLDTADKVRKVSPHPSGATITVQSTTMPGKPQVVVDAATGRRVITVVKQAPKAPKPKK